jgi:hypothetical protein
VGTPATLDGMTVTPVVQPDPPRITLRSPGDLIAAVPYLLGFHPRDSVVVVAFHEGRAVFAARSDLPGPDTPPLAAMAHEIIAVAARRPPEAVVLLGYGAAGDVGPLLRAIREAAGERGHPVRDVLRVDGDRWWSDLCEDPTCCPVEGTPIELATHEISAICTYAGLAALPDREALAGQVAPVGGLARVSMAQAIDRAERRFSEWLDPLPGAGWSRAVQTEGAAAVTAAIDRYASGGTLDDDELAWLSLLLVSIPVRDVAWQAITSTQPHLRLWADATRRVDPALVAAPASLLAFAAWRAGDGALAGLALERALREEPSYTMARLLMDGLQQGVPPSALDGWGTPEFGERPEGPDGSAGPRRHRRRPRRGRRRRSTGGTDG